MTLRNVEGPQSREFQIRSVDQDKREITGIAVPWDTPADIGGWYTEIVSRGAVQDSDNARLWWRHAEPIGLITSHRDTDEGWEITARISQTPRGEEAYVLVRDGVVDQFSIGFDPVEALVDEEAETVTRTRIRVREVSLVPNPAYEEAKVAQVREATTPTTEEAPTMGETITSADLTEIRQSIEDLGREVALVQTPTEPTQTGPQFRSIGHLVKLIAEGDETATRAYNGAVSGDTVIKDAWVGNLAQIIKKRRPLIEAFGGTGTLPAQGMGVEYGVLKSDTTQVGVQAAEGDDLLFGKVSIETKTAPVKTIGGWSSLSRQAIERASVGVLDLTFEALIEKYGQASEAYVRSIFNAAVAATGAGALAEVEADLTTQDGIVTAVLDLVEHFENVGRALDGVFVDKATFLALYSVEATKRVLQVSGQPEDKVGSLTVKTASGSVADLPFRLLPNSAGITAYDATALKALESPGAPTRLQDDNIVNLSKDFSVYGYLSAAVQKPAGLVKLAAS